MDLFSDFCNICCKTDGESLRNIAEDNMKYLKDTLITFLGYTDIINDNIINLCQLCCEKLTHFNKFREMCFSNLIQLRQNILDMKSKLELEDETCAVENALQIFVHEELERRKTLEHFADDCRDVSIINSVTECNESQLGVTKESSGCLKSERESDEDLEFIKEELDLNNETNSASGNIALRNFQIESGGHVNFDVNDINNSEGIVNAAIESMKEELHVKQKNSISGDLELETVKDEFDDGLNGVFEFVNVRSIATTQESGARSITIEENAKDDMKLPSRNRKNGTNAAVMNAQQNRPQVRILHYGRCPPTQQSRAHKRVYSDAESYACTVCSKSFNSRSNLIKHERIHTGERPYKCTICNKSFNTSGYLTVHGRIHSGDKPYKCIVCDKAFINSSGLIMHELTHRADRPYNCTVCSKSFSNSYHLIRHERIHSDERPYECGVCNKAFTDPSSLIRHKRVHSGDPPYKCTVCNKSFTYPANLTRHKRLHSGQ